MPQIKKEKVKSDGQVIAIAQVPVFASLQEMITDLTEAKVLNLASTQHGTNIKNNLRAEFSGKPTKAKLQQEAMAALAKTMDPNNPASIKDIQDIMSDETKRNEYFEKFEADATAVWQERRKQRIAEVAAQLKTETDVVDEDEEVGK